MMEGNIARPVLISFLSLFPWREFWSPLFFIICYTGDCTQLYHALLKRSVMDAAVKIPSR